MPASHLTDGELRASLDAELDAARAAHLAGCAACLARLAPLASRRAAIQTRLNRLEATASAARPALARFQARHSQQEKVTMFQRLFRKSLRPLWSTLAVAAVLIGALAFAPVRAWAGQLLNLFRIQQVTVLPVDTLGLQAITGDEALGQQISQMMASSATVLREPGAPQTAATAAEASQLAGFEVRVPAGAAPASLTVQGGSAFEFTLDRALAQGLLDELGRSDLQLPASVDGATVSVDVAAAVSSAYGTCPATAKDGARRQAYTDCVILVQMPSPVVNTPPDLDVNALALIGLQLTGMTADQAREYSATVDWTSTLVIPIPRNGAEYRSVAVDGVTGYLIQSAAGDAPEYVLVWVKDGYLYTLGGLSRNTTAALEMANALP